MKFTRNIKILLLLIVSAFFIELSMCIKEREKALVTVNEKEQIFSMKNKKIRTTATAKKFTSSKKTNTATTNTKTTVANRNTNTNTNTNKNKQVLTTDLNQANPDLLKQTNLIDAISGMNQDQPGDKQKIDLKNMGPITFHSWVKFFKYTDQVASDKNAKLRFNQNRKFFVNGEFREQLKLYPGENYQQLDGKGEYKYVSDPNRFYLIAFKSSVVIYQSKMVNY
jgi:hypothetical protein